MNDRAAAPAVPPVYHCVRCGHVWQPRRDRVAVRPQVCPKCKTYAWATVPQGPLP